MDPKDSLPHSHEPAAWARSIQSMPPSNFLKIHFNTFLPSIRRSSKWSLRVIFPHQNPVRTSALPHSCHMTHPSHSSWFDRPNNIWRAVQITKLPVTTKQFSYSITKSAYLEQYSLTVTHLLCVCNIKGIGTGQTIPHLAGLYSQCAVYFQTGFLSAEDRCHSVLHGLVTISKCAPRPLYIYLLCKPRKHEGVSSHEPHYSSMTHASCCLSNLESREKVSILLLVYFNYTLQKKKMKRVPAVKRYPTPFSLWHQHQRHQKLDNIRVSCFISHLFKVYYPYQSAVQQQST